MLIPRSLLDWTAKQLYRATSSLQQKGVQSQRRANQCGLNHTGRDRGKEQRGSNQVTQTRKSRGIRNVYRMCLKTNTPLVPVLSLNLVGPCHLFFSSSISSVQFTHSVQFSSVQSLSRVRLFATPWIAAHQASLSITNSRSGQTLGDSEEQGCLVCCNPWVANRQTWLSNWTATQSAPLTFGSKPTHLAFLVDKKVTVSYLQIYFFQPSLAGSSASQFLMYW